MPVLGFMPGPIEIVVLLVILAIPVVIVVAIVAAASRASRSGTTEVIVEQSIREATDGDEQDEIEPT